MGNLDFEKTFIQAIVYNYEVLKEYGTENDVRAAGKVMTKGKDYEMVRLVLIPFLSHNLADKFDKVDGDILLVKAGAAKS